MFDWSPSYLVPRTLYISTGVNTHTYIFIIESMNNIDRVERVKKLFDWHTYPIVVKLDLESLEETLVGGFEELRQELLSRGQ